MVPSVLERESCQGSTLQYGGTTRISTSPWTHPSDKDRYQLTGYGQFKVNWPDEWSAWERVRLLATGMTFAQQQEVFTSRIVQMSQGDSVPDLLSEERLGRPIPAINDRHTFGEAIAADSWSAGSREAFLNAFVNRFAVEIAGDALRLSFFRQAEIWRLATPFVELHHFLAFSALELLARSSGMNAANGNAAVPITDLLNRHGFSTTQAEIQKWCCARNAAFHRGLLVSIDPQDGQEVRLTEQIVPLTQVLCDVLLKELQFDDGHINWNRWRDRMGFR